MLRSMLIFLYLFIITATQAVAAYKDEIPVPFSQIVWDHQDVSEWAITSDLTSVHIDHNHLLQMPHTKACEWPMYDEAVNANSWVLHLGDNDEWHANTWDFMRLCQVEKHATAVGAPDDWRPVEGEEVYIFISGIARPGYTETVHERTNIVQYIWYGETGYPPELCTGEEEPPIIHEFLATPDRVVVGNTNDTAMLSWSTSNADTIRLSKDDGVSVETTVHDPIINGVEVVIDKTYTFTLTAMNECIEEEGWPIDTLTVKSIPVLIPIYQLLLLTGDNDDVVITDNDEFPVLDNDEFPVLDNDEV